MSVRVVARIRPLLKSELEKDSIVDAAPSSTTNAAGDRPTIVRIPNPKNAAEGYSFQFNSVYDQQATQQDLFDNEISPTVKHLFGGFDITMFAYGVTGTGKTHTMRGGKTLAERGVIPRLLSSIYRRGRKIEKDSNGVTQVEVSMSYYEIYNDKVFDLFEPPEKRTAAGLPIRDNNGKTVVAGLTERPCTSLKEFEHLYDHANVNRSTSATKLNAHSSRSHAILCVKVSQISEEHTIVSTASAIDLAGSEDNRRTDNGKERLVESSSINKSLFVLAQCVEAISKKQARIPYRESKMTRILSLGQNNGLTIMILNLAPVRSYHLDTLSSLNFANRTKKIEIREVENDPIYKGPAKVSMPTLGTGMQRQPLRPITASANIGIKAVAGPKDKPTKAFAVYAERGASYQRREETLKRESDGSFNSRPRKAMRLSSPSRSFKPKDPELSRASIEEMVNRLVEEKLATRVLNEATEIAPPAALSDEVQRRLEALEQRVEKKEDGRAEGLQYLLMAKQHHVRGEDGSALKMYRMALPFFPDNEKLASKMVGLQEKIREKRRLGSLESSEPMLRTGMPQKSLGARQARMKAESAVDEDYAESSDHQNGGNEDDYASDDSFRFRPKSKHWKETKTKSEKLKIFCDTPDETEAGAPSPRTVHLLKIINTRDMAQIRSLKGVGAKKAEIIVNSLCEEGDGEITGLDQLGSMKGVGAKTVSSMRGGISV